MANDRNGMHGYLRDFVRAHPEGWNHHDWLSLLAELTDAGLDTSNPGRIGEELEIERILAVLEGLDVKGLGPKRRTALAHRFLRLYDLRHASVEDLAELASFHRGLAEDLHDALR